MDKIVLLIKQLTVMCGSSCIGEDRRAHQTKIKQQTEDLCQTGKSACADLVAKRKNLFCTEKAKVIGEQEYGLKHSVHSIMHVLKEDE